MRQGVRVCSFGGLLVREGQVDRRGQAKTESL